MSTMTIRLPAVKHERLRRLAEARGISLNRLMDELATVALAEFDTMTRFRILAARGSREKGLRLLDKLDLAFARGLPQSAEREKKGSHSTNSYASSPP